MLKKIYEYIFGSLEKQSLAHLKAFQETSNNLIAINVKIAALRDKHIAEIAKLQEKTAVLDSVEAKNAKVAANINTLLGE